MMCPMITLIIIVVLIDSFIVMSVSLNIVRACMIIIGKKLIKNCVKIHVIYINLLTWMEVA